MSSGRNEYEEGRSQPTRIIHDAYEECVEARRTYIQATNTNGYVDLAHTNLQSAVFEFFEAMGYLLRETKAAEPYWDGRVTDDPTDPTAGKAYLWSEYRTSTIDTEGAEFDDDGTPDWSTVGLPEHVFVVDVGEVLNADSVAAGHAFPVYPVRLRIDTYGLKHIDGQFDTRQERLAASVGMLGVRDAGGTTTNRYEPRTLFRIADALERCAFELDLLAEVSDKLPTDHIGIEPPEDP